MTNFPRVMHVGFDPIGAPTNTGLTLQSMFAEWPRDLLREVYTPSRQSHQASEQAVIAPAWAAPVDGLARVALRGQLGGFPGEGPAGAPAPARQAMATSVGWRARSVEAVTMINDLGPVVARGPWVADLDRWRPDVIHCLLGGVRITGLVLALAKRLEVPVVPHFMDDWLTTLYSDGELFGVPRRRLERLVNRVLERSPLCLVVGEDMRREYETRLGKPCVVVGNSVDFDAARGAVALPVPARRHLELTYVGGLHLGRDEAIRGVGQALAGASGATKPWRLAVHVPERDRVKALALASDLGPVEVRDFLPPAEVAAVLRTSDALLFIESGAPEFARLTRLSVSTKVPEYIASRRPVLVVGPESQASVNELRRSGAAFYLGPDGSHLVSERGFAWLGLAYELSDDAWESMRETYDSAVTRERLRLALARGATAS